MRTFSQSKLDRLVAYSAIEEDLRRKGWIDAAIPLRIASLAVLNGDHAMEQAAILEYRYAIGVEERPGVIDRVIRRVRKWSRGRRRTS